MYGYFTSENLVFKSLSFIGHFKLCTAHVWSYAPVSESQIHSPFPTQSTLYHLK